MILSFKSTKQLLNDSIKLVNYTIKLMALLSDLHQLVSVFNKTFPFLLQFSYQKTLHQFWLGLKSDLPLTSCAFLNECSKAL